MAKMSAYSFSRISDILQISMGRKKNTDPQHVPEQGDQADFKVVVYDRTEAGSPEEWERNAQALADLLNVRSIDSPQGVAIMDEPELLRGKPPFEHQLDVIISGQFYATQPISRSEMNVAIVRSLGRFLESRGAYHDALRFHDASVEQPAVDVELWGRLPHLGMDYGVSTGADAVKFVGVEPLDALKARLLTMPPSVRH